MLRSKAKDLNVDGFFEKSYYGLNIDSYLALPY